MSNKSTSTGASRKPAKPAKPYADFPLFPHASRRWAKKVRGKLHYFGPWRDPDAALNLWLEQRDELLAGRTPRAKRDGLGVGDLANQFLTAKRHLVDTREIAQRTFEDYYATCALRLVKAFGRNRLVLDLAADDFERLRADLGKTWGPVSVNNEIGRIRVVFKYGYDAELIDRPVRFGPGFKRPSRKVLRQARAEKGPRLFEAEDLRRIIAMAGTQLKAMALLAINCGLGNSDCAKLRFRNLDLNRGWLDFPRPKTAIDRRCPLWPETVQALTAALAKRPDAKDEDDHELVFVTKYGRAWQPNVQRDSPITKEFAKLLVELGLKRPGLGFYALRHTTETIGSEARDQVALDHIMGHSPHSSDMSAVYRERIRDERLIAIADYVREWLYGESPSQAASPTAQLT